jgi:hypothetical protein
VGALPIETHAGHELHGYPRPRGGTPIPDAPKRLSLTGGSGSPRGSGTGTLAAAMSAESPSGGSLEAAFVLHETGLELVFRVVTGTVSR